MSQITRSCSCHGQLSSALRLAARSVLSHGALFQTDFIGADKVGSTGAEP